MHLKNNSNLYSNFCLIKSSEIVFISLPALYLMMRLMRSQKNFGKKPFLKHNNWFSSEISKLTSSNYSEMMHFDAWKKNHFQTYCLQKRIALTKCNLYCIWKDITIIFEDHDL